MTKEQLILALELYGNSTETSVTALETALGRYPCNDEFQRFWMEVKPFPDSTETLSMCALEAAARLRGY